jgi:hypothetical protein
MVEFFYNLDYNCTAQDNDTSTSTLQLHANMFKIGDRFDIPVLRDVAADHYDSECRISSASDFVKSVYDVYRGTFESVRQLRDIACRVAPLILNMKDPVI